MYIYITVVNYGFSSTKVMHPGILAATTQPELALLALHNATKRKVDDYEIENILIFKIPLNQPIDFLLLTSRANEIMPVCEVRQIPLGWEWRLVTDDRLRELIQKII